MDQMRVGIIDEVMLRRDCIGIAFAAAGVTVVKFPSVLDCTEANPSVDVLLFLPVSNSVLPILPDITRLNQCNRPVIVMATIEAPREIHTVRELLRTGARGYIPTLSTDLSSALAAIRFVVNGGTYAPLDNLLKPKTKSANVIHPSKLTDRQLEVLLKLREGKANKVIAYELGLTESTVKVHVRNIMRRFRATNRTQAVYRSNMSAEMIGSVSA
jgi:DNA-binding NarL/FixJ family response regulator